jgi:hypothetical protein
MCRNDKRAQTTFSRCGEAFCYLKLDESEGMRFADIAEIHDAVDGALREAEVGCAIGRGTGLRYTYVDLAVTDGEATMQTVRPILREGGRCPEELVAVLRLRLGRGMAGRLGRHAGTADAGGVSGRSPSPQPQRVRSGRFGGPHLQALQRRVRLPCQRGSRCPVCQFRQYFPGLGRADLLQHFHPSQGL